jgi:predicted methyltransferase
MRVDVSGISGNVEEIAVVDITYLGGDRAKMNKAFYDALKPGGELVVGDYSAKPGAGTSVVQTLHRSDEALVTSEIEAAGFKLIA